MSYRVQLSPGADKFLNKMNAYESKVILKWMYKRLEGCENPRAFGKGLTGNRSGQWRYRVGDYRLIADINDNEVLILIVDVNHRSKVYKD